MLISSGLSLDCLLPENKDNYITREDWYNIDYMTTKARANGGVLDYYGFGFTDAKEAESASANLLIPKNDLDAIVKEGDFMNTPLRAYCPNQDTIILWRPEHNTETMAHHMFKVNLREILKAMARVMSFDKVLDSSQFELAILRG